MKSECKMVTKMIAKWTQQETKMNLNLSSTQFSETHLPQARSGLLPQAIEIKHKIGWTLHWNKIERLTRSWGSRGGPTNQLFTPKIQSGTPWAPQGAPEGLQKVPWTIFLRIWSRFHHILIVFRSFCLWYPTNFRIKNGSFLQLAKQIFDWRTPDYFMKSTKKSDKLSQKKRH